MARARLGRIVAFRQSDASAQRALPRWAVQVSIWVDANDLDQWRQVSGWVLSRCSDATVCDAGSGDDGSAVSVPVSAAGGGADAERGLVFFLR